MNFLTSAEGVVPAPDVCWSCDNVETYPINRSLGDVLLRTRFRPEHEEYPSSVAFRLDVSLV